MSQRDPRITLRQMHDHAREAMSLFEGRTRHDLDQDRVLCLALVRLLEVLGEAARRVPSEIQTAHPEIAWSNWIGLRNRLIHAYDQIDLDIVSRILLDDLPVLVRDLARIPRDR